MKKLLTLFVAFLAVNSGLVAQDKTPTTAPVLKFEKTHHDFGKIKEEDYVAPFAGEQLSIEWNKCCVFVEEVTNRLYFRSHCRQTQHRTEYDSRLDSQTAR